MSSSEASPKRKTHTSSAVKNKYNAKMYRKFQATIKPELAQRIEDYLAQESVSRPEFLERAVTALEKERDIRQLEKVAAAINDGTANLTEHDLIDVDEEGAECQINQ